MSNFPLDEDYVTPSAGAAQWFSGGKDLSQNQLVTKPYSN